jgi:hypothetical protein
MLKLVKNIMVNLEEHNPMRDPFFLPHLDSFT